MAIEIRLEDDFLYCPVVICDLCSGEIDDACQSNYLWLPDENHLFFLHKHCTRQFEQKSERDDWMSGGIEDFLIYLLNNLSVALSKKDGKSIATLRTPGDIV